MCCITRSLHLSLSLSRDTISTTLTPSSLPCKQEDITNRACRLISLIVPLNWSTLFNFFKVVDNINMTFLKIMIVSGHKCLYVHIKRCPLDSTRAKIGDIRGMGGMGNMPANGRDGEHASQWEGWGICGQWEGSLSTFERSVYYHNGAIWHVFIAYGNNQELLTVLL